jgi:hypothetical protein
MEEITTRKFLMKLAQQWGGVIFMPQIYAIKRSTIVNIRPQSYEPLEMKQP